VSEKMIVVGQRFHESGPMEIDGVNSVSGGGVYSGRSCAAAVESGGARRVVLEVVVAGCVPEGSELRNFLKGKWILRN